MALITTNIKSNKSLLTFNVWLHYFLFRLLSYLCTVLTCVCLCVLVCFSLFVVIIVFFSDCRIYLFSSLAATVFNKLTRLRISVVCLTFGLSVTIVSPAKTAEPIEMSFGMWTRMDLWKHAWR